MPSQDIPFSAGIDNKTSPLLARAPSLLVADNVIYAEGGTPSKRNGFGVLPGLTRSILNPIQSAFEAIVSRATLTETASVVAPMMPLTDLVLGMEADGTGGGGSILYQDDAGMTPITANGQTVKSWLDPVSGALIANNSSGLIYETAGINGLPSVTIASGSIQGLSATVSSGTNPTLNANQLTAWMVLQSGIVPPEEAIFFGVWNSTGWLFETGIDFGNDWVYQINSGNKDGGLTTLDPAILCIQIDGSGGTYAAYLNGVLASSGACSTFSTGRTGTIYLGPALVGSSTLTVSVFAIQGGLFTPMDSGTGQAMNAYLSAKYGI